MAARGHARANRASAPSSARRTSTTESTPRSRQSESNSLVTKTGRSSPERARPTGAGGSATRVTRGAPAPVRTATSSCRDSSVANTALPSAVAVTPIRPRPGASRRISTSLPCTGARTSTATKAAPGGDQQAAAGREVQTERLQVRRDAEHAGEPQSTVGAGEHGQRRLTGGRRQRRHRPAAAGHQVERPPRQPHAPRREDEVEHADDVIERAAGLDQGGRRRWARSFAHATPSPTSSAGPKDPSVSSMGMPPTCALGITGRSPSCSRRPGGAPRGLARDRRVGRGSRRRSRGRAPSRPRASSYPHQPRAQPGIELVVPGRVERVGDVEPAPVQGELDHLRSAAQLAAGVGRACRAARRARAGRSACGLAGIGDVVLAQVAVQPVGEVEEAVVHRDDHVGDQAGHAAGQRPAVQLARSRPRSRARPGSCRWSGGSGRCCSRASRRRSPASASGSCSQRTSSGTSPCSPRSIVCSSRRSARSQKCSRCP